MGSTTTKKKTVYHVPEIHGRYLNENVAVQRGAPHDLYFWELAGVASHPIPAKEKYNVSRGPWLPILLFVLVIVVRRNVPVVRITQA